jgi:hypothetical protein
VSNLTPWVKGESGNPGGRPAHLKELRDLARRHDAAAIRTLVQVMKHSKSDQARVAAASQLLDRAYGKPVQAIQTDQVGALIVNIVSSQPDGPAESRGDRRIALPAPAAESREALRDEWLRHLDEDERRIVEVLISAHPNALERDAVAELVGFRRATLDLYLGRLVSRHFVISEGLTTVRATPELVPRC